MRSRKRSEQRVERAVVAVPEREHQPDVLVDQ